jgi:hypothetical protein
MWTSPLQPATHVQEEHHLTGGGDRHGSRQRHELSQIRLNHAEADDLTSTGGAKPVTVTEGPEIRDAEVDVTQPVHVDVTMHLTPPPTQPGCGATWLQLRNQAESDARPDEWRP